MPRPHRTEGAAAGDDEAPVLDSIATIGSYYRGTVCNLHRSPERGQVRTATGRALTFVFQHVSLRGAGHRFDDLREGMTVGYDVSWTARGLRVSTIWIPE